MDEKWETRSWVLRLFAASWAGLFALLALFLKGGWPDTPAWAAPLAVAVTFSSGLIWPAAMRRPYRVVEKGLRPVGELLAVVVLAAVYFGIFTPYSILLRLAGWDPLRLRGKHRGGTAWSPRPSGSSGTSFFWQY